jgi:hypothetical protein
MQLLDRGGLLRAFVALDEELGAVGVRAEVFVVGGAAMALAYDARRSTVDVDAIFVPSSQVREAAQRVAVRLGIEPDWLNDGAKGFMPGTDRHSVGVFEGEYLSVAAASPRYLLAMKLLAARLDRDQDDIRTLYELCGFTTAEEGLQLVEASYPSYVIAPRVQFLLQEMFPSHENEIAQPERDRSNREGPGLER